MPTPSDFHHTAEKKMAALESWMAPLFKQLPHLPHNARETLAKIAPALSLIFGILGLLALLSAGAFATILSVFSLFGGFVLAPLALFISVVTGIIACILEIMAYKPLSIRRKQGWNFLFYGTVLTGAANIVELVFAYGSLGGIVGSVIGLWLLFEVREMYS
ncbi:MAG: hypothetical protein WCG83_03650 [Candidatus Peregrinibacteria bacterium]